MKRFKSIKWRLQLWYGLILVLVLVGFGFTAYQLERGRVFARIDDGLHRRIGVLANAFRRPPPRRSGGNEQLFNRPPPGPFPDGGPPPMQKDRPVPEFHMSSEDAHFFDADDPNNFYFIIKTRDGKELAHSANAPPIPAEVDSIVPQPPDSRIQLATVDFGKYREIPNVLPSGEIIWVGCSIAPELKELHLTALKLAGFGGIILVFGLVGGGWLVGRALHPIDDISATAAKISAGDLSQRINVAEAESELGRLAAVLNSTFARLETAFAQQQQFTADAAHELRTPVTVMLTQAQTALTRERAAAEYRETVEACQRSAQRMRRLIESLLELARLDAGQEPLNRMPFDLSQMVREGTESVRPLADERGVKIRCELTPVQCVGDAERLAQVVTNLLVNAIQYNRDKGEVRVTTQSQIGLAVLIVADTGPGIPAADLPHIFERFYRADKARSAGRAGLGLAIAKAIVAAHGGTMEAASQTGTGTTFTVRLPAN